MTTEQEVLDFVLRGLATLTAEIDVGPITPETQLRALGLRSILLINFIAEVQDEFGLQNELLTTILTDTVPLEQRTVGELVAQVRTALNPGDG